MDVLGMGTGELLLVLLIALLVVGPEKLPGVARTLGRIVRQFKQASDDFTQQVTKEVERVEAVKKEAAQQLESHTGDLIPTLRDLDPRRIIKEDDTPASADAGT